MSSNTRELIFNLLKVGDIILLDNRFDDHYQVEYKDPNYIFIRYKTGILYYLSKHEMFLVKNVISSIESRKEFISIKVLERLSR